MGVIVNSNGAQNVVGMPWLWIKSGGALVSGPSSLLTNLISYWKLDEASGTRFDSVVASANDLTNNGSTQVAGKIGNAVSLASASSQWLAAPSNASLQTGVSFTIAAWVYLTDIAGNYTIASKYQGGGQNEWALYFNQSDHAPTNRFSFGASSNGSTATFLDATTFGAPSATTWYLVIAWYDSVAQTINIQVDNGTADSVAFTGGMFSGTSEFDIGRLLTLYYMNGRVDEVGFWKGAGSAGVLTATQRTNLYNSGNGTTHPFTGIP